MTMTVDTEANWKPTSEVCNIATKSTQTGSQRPSSRTFVAVSPRLGKDKSSAPTANAICTPARTVGELPTASLLQTVMLAEQAQKAAPQKNRSPPCAARPSTSAKTRSLPAHAAAEACGGGGAGGALGAGG